MEFYIWDKISNIKKASAEYILEDNPNRKIDDVVIFTINGNPTQIACKKDLIRMYNLDTNLTAEEIAKAYLEIKDKDKGPTEDELKIQELENIIKEQDTLIVDKEYNLAKLDLNKNI